MPLLTTSASERAHGAPQKCTNSISTIRLVKTPRHLQTETIDEPTEEASSFYTSNTSWKQSGKQLNAANQKTPFSKYDQCTRFHHHSMIRSSPHALKHATSQNHCSLATALHKNIMSSILPTTHLSMEVFPINLP